MPSGERLQLLVESITGYGIYMMDAEGAVTSWNRGAEAMTGYGSGEIVGQHFFTLFNEQDRASGVPAQILQEAAFKGQSASECWRIRKDGSQFFADMSVYPMRDAGGSPIGYAAIIRDITGKPGAMIALQKAEAQRGRAQRMEALGHLTGGIVHDFNNVLMVIGGFLQTLKKSAGRDPKAARAADVIEHAVERGQSLTRQLQTFLRRQTLNPVVTGVGERVEAFRKMLGSSNTGPAKIVANIPRDIWPVKADIGEFELALLNIALNARDAMPQGGVIAISAENVHLKPENAPDRLEGDFVALTIADTGAGNPEEARLGLAQVHSFAHQADGSVAIDSKLGHGTSVTLYLPRAQAVPEQPAAEQPVKLPAGGKALLVDDNRDVLEVSALYLQELGYDVDAVESALPALKAIEHQKYSLVVSDVVMAGMDGIDLAEAIRRRQPDMPIVLVTGYSRVPDSVGREFVLVRKPYQLADLSKAVTAAIAAAGRLPAGNLMPAGVPR